MTLRPLHDRIIVKRLEEERKSAGGIVIPDTAAEKPSQGEIIAAGPGKLDDNGKVIAMGVKVGDKILFGKYSGQEFKMDGQDLLHMREDDVAALRAQRHLDGVREDVHAVDHLVADAFAEADVFGCHIGFSC